MKKQLIRRNVLLAFLAAGMLYMPVMAEGTITYPVTVSDKNAVINDKFDVKEGPSPTAIHIPQSASGGEIYINSPSIKVERSGNSQGDIGLIELDNGYKGTVYVHDGTQISGKFSGTNVWAEGLRMEDEFNLINRNTGKPAGGTAILGNNISINLENINDNSDEKHPVVENWFRGILVNGETLHAGDNLKIHSKAYTREVATVDALDILHYGDVSIGDNAEFSIENYTKGPMNNKHNGNDAYIISSMLQAPNESQRVSSLGYNKLHIGDYAKFLGTYVSDENLTQKEVSNQGFMGFCLENIDTQLGNSAQIIMQGNGSAKFFRGVNLQGPNPNRMIIGNDMRMDLSMNGSVPEMEGYILIGNAKSPFYFQLGDNSKTNLFIKGPANQNNSTRGLQSKYSQAKLGNNADISIKAVRTKSSSNNCQAFGLVTNPGVISTGRNLHIDLDTSGYNFTAGIYAANKMPGYDDSNVKIGDGFSLQIKANGKEASGDIFVEGIQNSNSSVYLGKRSQISIHTIANATANVIGITTSKGTTDIDDDASVIVDNDTNGHNWVLRAHSGGVINFAGSAYIQGNKEAAYADGDGSRISLMGSGKKTILGDLVSKDNGSILLKLPTSDSLFRGKSSVLNVSENEDVSAADTELSLSNGAKWQMTDTSYVTKLANNSGTVDMQYNPNYQDLHIGSFSGNDGVFKMKSDLESQTDGDKVTIENAEAGSTGVISVYDKSLATGKEVTGARHLLMVTDSSKNATFKGESINTGGLWEITPSIREGGTFADADGHTVGETGEWYLASVQKTINKDTKPLIDAGDDTYGLYRMSIDTLRKRLGDIRYRNRSEDKYDIWARNRNGHFDGHGYDSKYNFLQIGVDTMPNDKSAYGFLVERGIASPNYDTGSGKNHTLAGALYATWIGDHGSYTDIVAKVGRNDTSLHTYGEYADRASYREDEKSLSLEYGKTLSIGNEGYFFETQAQFVFGHLGSNSYTTRRGTHVHEDSFDSAIGRLGFVLGKKEKNGENPHDFYLKASVLHEFGGDRDYSLRRMNAYGDEESLDGSYNYRDTWFEVGFGGNVKINNNTSFYADVERSFGSDYSKKWQLNAGINWSF